MDWSFALFYQNSSGLRQHLILQLNHVPQGKLKLLHLFPESVKLGNLIVNTHYYEMMLLHSVPHNEL